MTRPPSVVPWLLGLALAAGCAEEVPDHWLGYVEGEYVHVAAPLEGELVRLVVSRGDRVERDAPLFELDPNPQALQVAEVEQRVHQARALLANLEKGGRPSELAALEARLASARAALARAEGDFERRRELHLAGRTDVVSKEELDRYRFDMEARRGDVAALEADLETARLGGRADAVEAARREVEALQASAAELRWRVEQKAVSAPAAGTIQDTLYRVGELVPAGRPVVSLLPPENLKVRFFVPQAVLPGIAVGDRVEVFADGWSGRVGARVTFLSTEAEFTPPVIYSRESRAKLVFLVEAAPDPGAVERLRPGQPLEVFLAAGAADAGR